MRRTQLGISTIAIERLVVSAYTVPTDFPEADGTLEWDSTTIIVVEAYAGGKRGLGYTYGDAAVARLIDGKLADVVKGIDGMRVSHVWSLMVGAIRNLGRPGISSMAISAVDAALWDLKARLLDVPLVMALDAVHDSVPVYGSGGFTTYPIERLQGQLGGWVEQGMPRVKMKVGSNPAEDVRRVEAARNAIGDETELFVDANGAYSRKQALAFAEAFTGFEVSWFEEPVTSDDLEGLRLLRDRAPAGIQIAAGEYGYDLPYFRRMLDAGAVDVLQADVTRCGGITGFLQVGALCNAHALEFSAHTAPQLSTHACCAVIPLRHLEYFHDHVRIEQLLFDGILEPFEGTLYPDLSRPGVGIELKRSEAERYSV